MKKYERKKKKKEKERKQTERVLFTLGGGWKIRGSDLCTGNDSACISPFPTLRDLGFCGDRRDMAGVDRARG